MQTCYCVHVNLILPSHTNDVYKPEEIFFPENWDKSNYNFLHIYLCWKTCLDGRYDSVYVWQATVLPTCVCIHPPWHRPDIYMAIYTPCTQSNDIGEGCLLFWHPNCLMLISHSLSVWWIWIQTHTPYIVSVCNVSFTCCQ